MKDCKNNFLFFFLRDGQKIQIPRGNNAEAAKIETIALRKVILQIENQQAMSNIGKS